MDGCINTNLNLIENCFIFNHYTYVSTPTDLILTLYQIYSSIQYVFNLHVLNIKRIRFEFVLLRYSRKS